jgi:signal transduction histidine kinase
MRDFEEAEKQFMQALELAEKYENLRYVGENNVYLAKVKIARQQYAEAIPFLQQAERIAQTEGYNELLIDVYRQYSILYTEWQNHEKASEYQRKYIQLKDSVYSEELIDRIAQIQTNYAERENLAIIRAKEEVIRRQRMLNFSIGLIALLAASMLFIMFRSNLVIKKVNHALSQAKLELEALNRDLDQKVKEKTASLEKLNQEMEHFIYKTSHDIRGPLATLKGITGVALMDVKDPEAVKYFNRLDVTATKLNRVLSRLLIVNQVNQATLVIERINIGTMVDEIIRQESRNGLPPGMKIIKEVPEGLNFPSDRQLLAIILSNLIDNAVKFRADSERVEPFVKVTAAVINNALHIHVLDNGVGINENDREKIFQIFYRGTEKSETGGVGLYLCRLATERLQGRIGVSVTHQERYTDFFVELPAMEVAQATA